MKRLSITLFAVCLVSLVASDALAQRFVSGTYSVCDMNRQTRADEIVEQVVAPLMDAQVADGSIQGWGWLAHHGGGAWRRVLYSVGTDLGDLEEARDGVIQSMIENHSSALREYTSICGTHDDYVWSFVSGSTAADQVITNRPSGGLSIYMECDWSRGARVDELMEVLAATANEMKAAGKINSWSFWSHIFGGPYSRLFVIDGASHAANLEAIHEMGGLMAENHSDAFTEFQSLCQSHQDYMWDIKIARP